MKKTHLRKKLTKWFTLFWYLSFFDLFWYSVLRLRVQHFHCVSRPWPALEIILSLLFIKSCSGSLPSIRMKGGHRLCRNSSVMLIGSTLPLLDTEPPTLISIPRIERSILRADMPSCCPCSFEIIDIEIQTDIPLHRKNEKVELEGFLLKKTRRPGNGSWKTLY